MGNRQMASLLRSQGGARKTGKVIFCQSSYPKNVKRQIHRDMKKLYSIAYGAVFEESHLQ